MRMWVATVRARRLVAGLLVVVGVAAVGRYVFRLHPPARATPDPKGEIVALVNRLLDERAQALIRFDDGALAPHYDRSSVYGQWALEHEQRRLRYLRAWAEKRQIDLVSASSGVRVTNVRLGKDEAWVSLLQSTRLGYVYRGDPTLEKHLFGIGTRHAMQLVEQGGRWVIRRDWYTDPLDEDSLVPEVTPADVAASGGFLEPLARAQALGGATCSPPGDDQLAALGLLEQVRSLGEPAPTLLARAWQLVSGIPGQVSRFVGLAAGSGRPRQGYDREAAARYARTYCGAAWGCGNAGRYNAEYIDYTDIGGDCTNFASQVLHAGGLPMDHSWYYRKGSGGSRAWVQTLSLLDHLLATGRAKLIARGRFADVVKATDRHPKGAVNELEPGDLIGYQEKGRLVHFAPVVGRDFRGYIVVNSHTADRNAVPWDVGWDQATIFWLLKVRS